MTQDTQAGRVLDHPAFGRLEIVDDTDPSLLTVRNKNANTFKIGRLAAGWPVPDYVQGIKAAVVTPPPAPPKWKKPAPRPSSTVIIPRPAIKVPVPRPAMATSNGTTHTVRRKPMDAKVIEFLVERETKNTVRYEEQTEGQPPSVGTLYVQKWALGNPVPQKLKITIESGD